MGVFALFVGLSALTGGGSIPHFQGAVHSHHQHQHQHQQVVVTHQTTIKAETRMYRGLEKKTDYAILKEMPHDPAAFTQGLVYEDGIFYEGTGLYGKSQLRRVEVDTGKVLEATPLESRFFGEGITTIDDKIIQITWRERTAFIYNKADLKPLGSFIYDTYNHEGWGITTDGNQLIVSDGSQWIFFWDKETYKETRRIRVEDGFGNAVTKLNELEYAHGYIWANIWLSDDIVQIDPADGKIVAFYDFSSLFPAANRTSVDQVLNGIAYDAKEDVFYMTGKWWPKAFSIKVNDI